MSDAVNSWVTINIEKVNYIKKILKSYESDFENTPIININLYFHLIIKKMKKLLIFHYILWNILIV